MSTKIYAKNYIIDESMVNDCGFIKNSSLFAIFQDIARDHSSKDGYGDDVVRPLGLAWVVANQVAEISRMPRLSEEIVVNTWVDDVRMMFSPRHFSVKTAAGELLIEACSFWALMDLGTRETVNPSDYGLHIEGAGIASSSPRLRSPKPTGISGNTDYTVGSSLIDENSHVNNAKYFDIVDEVVGDGFGDKEPASIVARYAKEVIEGEVLAISWGFEDGRCYFASTSENGDCFKLEMKFRE